MGTHHGKNGVVQVGANSVAEVQEFTVVETADTVEDTAMGDTAKTHLVGITGWNGTLKCSWDPSDANGQEMLVAGASVTLSLYPAGAGAGQTKLSGTATIKEVTHTVNRSNVVERSFNFEGNGPLTKTTV
jgi:hypothetical protein